MENKAGSRRRWILERMLKEAPLRRWHTLRLKSNDVKGQGARVRMFSGTKNSIYKSREKFGLFKELEQAQCSGSSVREEKHDVRWDRRGSRDWPYETWFQGNGKLLEDFDQETDIICSKKFRGKNYWTGHKWDINNRKYTWSPLLKKKVICVLRLENLLYNNPIHWSHH